MPKSKTKSVAATAAMTDSSPSWILLLIEGFCILFLGWQMLATPAITTVLLVQLLGLYWIIAGIIDTISAIMDKNTESRDWTLAGSIIGIIAGLIVINNVLFASVLTTGFMVYFISFAFLINGGIKVVMGNNDLEAGNRKRSWSSFFVGLFYILFGILLLAMPLHVTLKNLALSAGLLGIVGGIGMIIAAFQLKSLQKQAK